MTVVDFFSFVMIPNLVVVLYDDDVLHPVISILITYEHTTDIPPPFTT